MSISRRVWRLGIVAAAAAATIAVLVAGVAGRVEASCASEAAGVRPSALEPANLDTILKRLQHRYDCSRALQANFDEKISSPGGMTRTRKGTVYFKKVGRMRWEFAAPSEGTVVSDGKTVYDYERDLNQVVEMPVNKALKSSATTFLLGLGNIKRDFKVSLPAQPPADGLTHIVLVPRGGGGDTMELGLDPKSYEIVKFKLTNQIGGVTEVEFSAIRTNVALDDSLFKFTVPAGADIVQPRQN